MHEITQDVWHDYRTRLVRFVRSRIHDDQAAEDIVHDALANAWMKKDTLRDENALLPWLFQITMNAVRDHRRARLPNVAIDDEVSEEVSAENIHELASCMTSMIEQLDEPYRSAIKRSEIEGTPMRIIADDLQISISGVKSRVQRGRVKLKELVLECCRLEVNSRGEITNSEDHICNGPHCGCGNSQIA